jgi:hypothetical protein
MPLLATGGADDGQARQPDALVLLIGLTTS